VGTRITGKVRNLTSFGAFVEIEPGIDGLIHISDMSWTKRVQHPSEVVKKTDEVEVVILNIDPDNKRISLGLKQAQEDPWLEIGEQYPVGMELNGRVVRFQDDGVIVDLGNDLEGFVPKNDLGLPEKPPVEEQVQLGQHVALTIVEVDPIHHRVLAAAREFLDEVDPLPETPVAERAEEPSAEQPPKPEGDEAAVAERAEEPSAEEEPPKPEGDEAAAPETSAAEAPAAEPEAKVGEAEVEESETSAAEADGAKSEGADKAAAEAESTSE
jgi:small subunit ribosomal protein S1